MMMLVIKIGKKGKVLISFSSSIISVQWEDDGNKVKNAHAFVQDGKTSPSRLGGWPVAYN